MSSEDWLESLDTQVLTDDLKSDIIDEFEGAKIKYAINILKNHIEHPKRPGYKRFSTKEAAENYILFNKPCLSINDIATVYKTANQFPEDRPNSQGNLLLNLVKSKIK